MKVRARKPAVAQRPDALRPLPLPGAATTHAAPLSLHGSLAPPPRALRRVESLGPPGAPRRATGAPNARAFALLRQAREAAAPALGPAVRAMLEAAEELLVLGDHVHGRERGRVPS